MPPMEGMWRLARFTDLGELFPDASYGGDVDLWRLARFTDLGELFPDAPYGGDVEVSQVC